MNSRERVLVVLEGGTPDRIPRSEVWIDALYCIAEGGPNGFTLSSCNSIFPGMNPTAVREFFMYQAVLIERQPARHHPARPVTQAA